MNPQIIKTVVCDICGSNNYKKILEAGNIHGLVKLSDEKFDLVKCSNCGLVYINPRPEEKNIFKYYNFDYYGTSSFLSDLFSKLSNLYKIRKIKKYKNKGKILDVGCGNGAFLFHITGSKWECYGVEKHPEGFKAVSSSNKINLYNCDFADCELENNNFDVVTMWHSFEHFYNLHSILKKCHRILNEKGILVMDVPNIDSIGFKLAGSNWFHLDAPRHLNHFNIKTMELLLKNNNFEIIKTYYPFLEFPFDLSHSLFRGNMILKIFSFPIIFLIKFISSVFGKAETMVVICRKA